MSEITTMKQFAYTKLSDVLSSRYVRDEKKKVGFEILEKIFDNVTEEQAIEIYTQLADTENMFNTAMAQVKRHAAQQSVVLTGLESPPKCTTEKLCPVHNVWHAAPPRN